MSQATTDFRASSRQLGAVSYPGPVVSNVRLALRGEAIVPGAGREARSLGLVYRRQLRPDPFNELGWQRPPSQPIPVALSGRVEPDWHLEADELAF